MCTTVCRAGPRDVVAGGALKAEVLNRAAKSTKGGVLGGSGGPPPDFFFKIFVCENAFQAILKPIFPYSITSISSKVRHSNTLFFAINFSFPCHPLGALVRLCYFIVARTYLAYQITFFFFFLTDK